MTTTYRRITSRLGNLCAQHRCPKCGDTMTVDRSRAGTCIVECVACDCIIVARLTGGRWTAARCEPDAMEAPPVGGEWMPKRGHKLEASR